MRGETLTVNRPQTFRIEECAACGVLFAMTWEFYDQRMKDGDKGSFYCPNGHGQHYSKKSDAQLRAEAEERARQCEARLQSERDQRLAAERELKRQRQRAKAGACPCCKRSFVQLARHMKSKHPDFAP